ncbi:hypothetical protein KF840_08530 [bacterium]|nr:hypothetical protein [bacterium]
MVMVAALLFGCVGRRIDPVATQQLQPGMTYAEVIALLGPPYHAISGLPPDDGTSATWVHGGAFTGVQALTLRFDGDGKLLRVPAGARP